MLVVLAAFVVFAVYHLIAICALGRECRELHSYIDTLLAERRTRIEADVRRDIKMAPPMDRRGSFVRH